MIRRKTKTAKPLSVELCEYVCGERGLSMAASTVTLTVFGDCISKIYNGNRIESLNPPFSLRGDFRSVDYCQETNITTIVYLFDPSTCILNHRTCARLFATRMQRQINRDKLKDFKAELRKQSTR